jgi:hypothetical protein
VAKRSWFNTRNATEHFAVSDAGMPTFIIRIAKRKSSLTTGRIGENKERKPVNEMDILVEHVASNTRN